MPKVLPRHKNDANGNLSWDEYYNIMSTSQKAEFWKTTSGSVVTSFSLGSSQWGDGSIEFQNVGAVELDIRIPIDGNLGASGYMRISTNSGTSGSFTAGVNCYDSSMNFLGARNFLVNGTTVSTSDLLLDGFIFDFGANTNQFPSATSFIKPKMSWGSLSNKLVLETMLVRPLDYANKSLYA